MLAYLMLSTCSFVGPVSALMGIWHHFSSEKLEIMADLLILSARSGQRAETAGGPPLLMAACGYFGGGTPSRKASSRASAGYFCKNAISSRNSEEKWCQIPIRAETGLIKPQVKCIKN